MNDYAVHAIWWNLETHKFELRTRSTEGTTATFTGSGLHDGLQLETYNNPSTGARYDRDDANPRRQGRNTVTLAEAKKLAARHRAAADARMIEANDAYKTDPSLFLVRREIEHARTADAVLKLKAAIASGPTLDNLHGYLFDPHGEIAQAARRLDNIETAKLHVNDNPWACRDMNHMFSRLERNEAFEAAKRTSDERVLFVVAEIATPVEARKVS